MTSHPFYLGCPVWACHQWCGSLYSKNVKRHEWLGEYSQVFPTVEVNSTFYALPPLETIHRWCAETKPGFQFCFKFPRQITHEQRLTNCKATLNGFLNVLAETALAGRLGPAFLQLPPQFSVSEFDALANFLHALPSEFSYAVEVRHQDWFDQGPHEERLECLLKECRIDRCLFDSRALFSRPPDDDFERKSQQRKPRSPFRTSVIDKRPMVRLVGRNQVNQVAPWWQEWSQIISKWVLQGFTPYVFTHAPDDAQAPQLARHLWQNLSPEIDFPMPAWPGESSSHPRQKLLFD